MKSFTPSHRPVHTRPRTRLRWGACALLGAGAGLLNGLLGAAGGILLVALLPRLTPPPSLYPQNHSAVTPLSNTLDRRDTLATALSVMLPVSAVSGLFYWLGGVQPEPLTVAVLVLPAVLGGLLGAKLLGKLPQTLLRKLFAALVVVSGARMLF